jgi:hypothetical protein
MLIASNSQLQEVLASRPVAVRSMTPFRDGYATVLWGSLGLVDALSPGNALEKG